jgi:hypothetical protein
MKKYLEPIRTFVFLGIAAWLAFQLTSRFRGSLESLADFLEVSHSYLTDPKFILPFLTPIIYVIVQVLHGLVSTIPWMYKIPIIGLLFDSKSMFVGTYLSLPADKDLINIFKIKFNSFGKKYKLNGYAYSLAQDHQIGDWESEKLDMKTTEPVALSYIYEGDLHAKNPVRGHVYIKFDDDRPTRSRNGYYVDVDKVGKADWTRSHYVMVTPQIKKKIIPQRIYLDGGFPFVRLRRYVNKPSSIFKAYHQRKDILANDPDFKRPTP